VLGRIKELIIVRGRNYQPDDIEDVLEQHDGVRKGYSVAFAVNNVDRGTDDVVALVETRVTGEAQTALARQIQQSLQSAFGFLADALVFVPHGTLPRTTSGKRQRVLAQQMFRDGLFRKDGE
jgi:fatty-acyl-CoA synthase